MNSSCGICRFRQATLTPQKQGMLKRPHNSREEHLRRLYKASLRLNDGIEIAAEKGSNETLVLVDKTAFVVSVKNRTVITTMSQEDLKGNIFTNIDSTVIM